MISRRTLRSGFAATLVAALVAGTFAMGVGAASAVPGEELSSAGSIPVSTGEEANAAQGAVTATLAAEVTELPNDRIIVDLTGEGFAETVGDSGTIALGLVEKDADLAAAEASGTMPRAVATVTPEGTLGAAGQPIEQPADQLDNSLSYEVVAWPAELPADTSHILARADAAIDWSVLMPTADDAAASDTALSLSSEASQQTDVGRVALVAVAPTLSATLTEVPDTRVDFDVTGFGFDDVVALPNQTVPHVYVMLIEKDSDLSTIAQGETSVSLDVVNGTIRGTLKVPADELAPGKSYELISWPSRTNPTEANLYARADVTIDWNKLFPRSGPTISGEVTEFPEERVDIDVTGFGFDDVVALPNQTAPHVYVMLIEKDSDLSTIAQGETSVSLDVVNGTIRGTLKVPADELAPGKSYELISWPSRTNPTEANLYARADVTIDWNTLFPADAVRLNASVTHADAATGLTVDANVENLFVDDDEKVTVALVDSGKRIVRSTDVLDFEVAQASEDGTLSVELTARKSFLDRTKSYHVVVFAGADFAQAASSEVTRSSVAVTPTQWEAIFGPLDPATVSVEKVAVVKSGLSVDVKAAGLPGDLIYVAIIERGTEAGLSQDGGYADFRYQPTVTAGSGKFNFIVSKDKLDRTERYEVLIWKSHSDPVPSNIYGRANINITDAQWDALAGTTPVKPEEPAAPAPTGEAAPGSLVWGISSDFADYTTNPNRAGGKSGGKVVTSGVGGAAGGYLFPQAAGGNWDRASQTGTVQYSGVVTFTAHKGVMNETFSNPIITVSSATSGSISVGGHTYPLALSSASKSVGANGEVTWSGVPVLGTITGGDGASGGATAIDPLSFTVGSVSAVSYGSTATAEKTKPKRTAAATPPATTGVRVLTDAKKIKAGGRIEIEASGFDANDEGVLVVLYSDPIVLDDSAKANANGVVTWSGTLPDDIEGEHVITLQGSTNAGAIIEIVDDEETEKQKAAKKLAKAAEAAEVRAAGVGVLSNSGIPLWEWWASAAGLVLIAACTTTLAVRQRRNNS